MNDESPSRAAQLVKLLDAMERETDATSHSHFSDEELLQLNKARRALTRLEKLGPADFPQPQESTPRVASIEEQSDTHAARTPMFTQSSIEAIEWNDPSLPTQPRRLGRFEVQSILGRGGFGVVWLARDPKLDEHVALKIPRSELILSSEARQRLLREARAATILSHPNIVPLYESGMVNVVPYISFGYCKGPTLADWIKRDNQRVTPHLAAQIVARLATAVQHAHSRGIIHRDLKPTNVMLSEECSPDATAKTLLDALRIADFGLATASTGEADLTRTGSPLGTPAYMSPEQARGDADIGAASDIFSLGIMLYEMLTGTQPFKRQTDLATLRAVEETEPISIQRLSANVPKDLSAIVSKCLQKSTSDRYESAQELESDLHRFLNNEPVQARPVGMATKLVRWCSRNPVIATSVLVTFLALSGGLGFSLRYAAAAKASAGDAEKSAEEADRRYTEAVALAQLFQRTYESFREVIRDDIKGNDNDTQELKRKLVDATREHYQFVLAQRPNAPEVLREYVDMLRPMAYQLELLGDMQTSSRIWKEAADVLQSEFPDEVLEWAALSGKLVEDYTHLQKTDEAVALSREIVAELRGLDESALEKRKVTAQLVHVLTAAAVALKGNGDSIGANLVLDDAQQLVTDFEDCEIQDWPVHRTWARLIRTRCEVIENLKQYDELLELAPIGIKQYEALRENPKYVDLALDSLPTFHNSLGVVSADHHKDYDQALKKFREGLSLREELIKRHPEMAWLYANAANSYQRIAQVQNVAGDHGASIASANKQIDRLKSLRARFGELKPLWDSKLLEAYWILGSAHYGADQRSKAIEAANDGIELSAEMQRDQPLAASTQGRIGTLFSIKAFSTDRMDQRREAVEKAISYLQSAIEGGSPIFQTDLDSALKLRKELLSHR
ncbi:MAG: serine/threonine-protein kinase [Planctomycetota bacterium]